MKLFRWLGFIAWIAVAAWAISITILSSFSADEIEKINFWKVWDKTIHTVAFALGAALLALALRWKTSWNWGRIIPLVIVAISAFGAIDEWHQLYTPGRSGADVYDWLADTIGAFFGSTLTALTHALFQRPSRPASSGP